MQSILWQILTVVGLTSGLVFGSQARTQAQSTAVTCGSDEGTAIETTLDLEFCSGTSHTNVASFETPQSGARILTTSDGGIAHRAGLRAGDVVYQVAGRRVDSGKAAADAVANPAAPGPIVINFWRDGRTYLVRIWISGPFVNRASEARSVQS